MPWVNGLEVLRWSRAEHPEIKVIIVTVHVEDAHRQVVKGVVAPMPFSSK